MDQVNSVRRNGPVDMLAHARWPLILLMLLYWATSLERLAVYPLVGEDEPWIAAAPYKLATEGIFGSDLFAGYYGMDRHHYQHLPAFHLLEAGVFFLGGVGVFQMRLLPVILGLLILPLSFAVGRQIGGARAGIVAVLLLCTLRFAGGATVSGIPLLDIARINRYDVGVPAMGLAALWMFDRAEKTRAMLWYGASGAAAGLAGLFHMYGLFWLAVFWLILLSRRGVRLFRQKAAYSILAGACLVWLPWLLYVAAGWNDFLGQQRFIADRLDLLNIRFYLTNLLHEIDRYRAADIFDEAGRLQLTRPGLWATLFGLPISLLLLWRERRQPGQALILALGVHIILFALLLKQKHYNYMIAFWPLMMVALACGGALLWRPNRARFLVLLVLLPVLVEGLAGISQRRTMAARVTPYETYMAEVADYIPEHSLVLGLQHYWLGLRQYPYRTWLLPLFMAEPRWYSESLTLEQALERVDPDVVLIDRHMAQLFARMANAQDPDHERYLQFWRFMERHEAVLVGAVEDGDYGRMEVFRLSSGRE